MVQVSWEDLEISEGEIEDIQKECEKEISLKIGISTSIGNDCDYEDEPQPKRAKH